MAIEKDINPTVLNEENRVPLGQENMKVAIEAIMESGTEGFEMQEDGSAILGESITEEIDTDFDSNLAEVLDPQELRNIANELIAGIEKDKASRDDWEKTYKDGLEYLGMRFDEERSEPFVGASGYFGYGGEGHTDTGPDAPTSYPDCTGTGADGGGTPNAGNTGSTGICIIRVPRI